MLKVTLIACIAAVLLVDHTCWARYPRNQIVTRAEYYKRNLINSGSSSRGGRAFNFEPIHAGIKVTLADNSVWLIERGLNYGTYSDTRIRRNPNMSGWWRTGCKQVCNRKTVADFMAVTFENQRYNLVTSNCQHAANAIWSLIRHCPNC